MYKWSGREGKGREGVPRATGGRWVKPKEPKKVQIQASLLPGFLFSFLFFSLPPDISFNFPQLRLSTTQFTLTVRYPAFPQNLTLSKTKLQIFKLPNLQSWVGSVMVLLIPPPRLPPTSPLLSSPLLSSFYCFARLSHLGFPQLASLPTYQPTNQPINQSTDLFKHYIRENVGHSRALQTQSHHPAHKKTKTKQD